MRRLVLLAAASIAFGSAEAADGWSMETYANEAFNFRHGVRLTRGGGAWPGARWSERAAWEVALTHRRLSLDSPPRGLSKLAVRQGLNIVSIDHAYRSGDWTTRLGAGPIVSHAESTIGGTSYDGPYRLSGAALVASAAWRFQLHGTTFLSLEAMFTAARSRPILPAAPSAELMVSTTAIQAIVGLGVEF